MNWLRSTRSIFKRLAGTIWRLLHFAIRGVILSITVAKFGAYLIGNVCSRGHSSSRNRIPLVFYTTMVYLRSLSTLLGNRFIIHVTCKRFAIRCLAEVEWSLYVAILKLRIIAQNTLRRRVGIPELNMTFMETGVQLPLDISHKEG